MKRKIAAVIGILLLTAGLPACAGETYVEITTGGSNGSYYKVGEVIADTIDDNLDTMVVAAEPGYGSIANCFLIKDGKTQVATVESNIADWAYNGEEMFEGQPVESLRVIAALYPHPIQIVTLTGNEIALISDLAGKRVCVGVPGSAMYADAVNVLSANNLEPADITAQTVSYEEGLSKLEDGQTDAVILTAAEPNESVSDVTESHTILLIPFEDTAMKTLIHRCPFYTGINVEAEVYKSIDDEILSAATMTLLVCSADMDSEIVYRITKTLWENIEIINDEGDQAGKISLETALDGISIPIHPGAQQYYDEVIINTDE